MIDCYVLVQDERDPRFSNVVFEGHVGIDPTIYPERLKRALEDVAFSWGYDSEDLYIHVSATEPDFDFTVGHVADLELAAKEILASGGLEGEA